VETGKQVTTFNEYLISPSFKLHTNCLIVIGKPPEKEYIFAFRNINQMQETAHWWIGDLANSYEGQYGSIKRLAEDLQFELGTIYNDKSVAAKYEPSCRHEGLSYEHHRIAAPWKDREYWFKRAEENAWPVRNMQLVRKKEKGTESPTFDDFRRTASQLLNISDGLLQEYKQARPMFRDEFEELVEQLLNEVKGLQFEVDITKLRYPPKLLLTRKDFTLD